MDASIVTGRRHGATSGRIGRKYIGTIDGREISAVRERRHFISGGRRVRTPSGGSVSPINGTVGERNINAIDGRDVSVAKKRSVDIRGRRSGIPDRRRVDTTSRNEGVGGRNISPMSVRRAGATSRGSRTTS